MTTIEQSTLQNTITYLIEKIKMEKLSGDEAKELEIAAAQAKITQLTHLMDVIYGSKEQLMQSGFVYVKKFEGRIPILNKKSL